MAQLQIFCFYNFLHYKKKNEFLRGGKHSNTKKIERRWANDKNIHRRKIFILYLWQRIDIDMNFGVWITLINFITG